MRKKGCNFYFINSFWLSYSVTTAFAAPIPNVKRSKSSGFLLRMLEYGFCYCR